MDDKFSEFWASGHMFPAGPGVVLDILVTQNQLLPKRGVPRQVFEAVTCLWQPQEIWHREEAKDEELNLSWEAEEAHFLNNLDLENKSFSNGRAYQKLLIVLTIQN